MFARSKNKSTPSVEVEKTSEIKDLGGGVSFLNGLPSAEEIESFRKTLEDINSADFLVYCVKAEPSGYFGKIQIIRVGNRSINDCSEDIIKSLPENRALSVRTLDMAEKFEYMTIEFHVGADLRQVVFNLGATTFPGTDECDDICAKASNRVVPPEPPPPPPSSGNILKKLGFGGR